MKGKEIIILDEGKDMKESAEVICCVGKPQAPQK